MIDLFYLIDWVAWFLDWLKMHYSVQSIHKPWSKKFGIDILASIPNERYNNTTGHDMIVLQIYFV